MNAFGIDHQRTLTQVTVLEGAAGQAVPHPVSDGARTAIPNAADAALGAWASAALAVGREQPLEALPGREWRTGGDEAYFWARLAERLTVHLGRGLLGGACGYAVTIATQDEAFNNPADDALKSAGFPAVEHIAATTALLAAFIAKSGQAEAVAGSVVAVAAGDTDVTIRAFDVEDGIAKRAGASFRLTETGHAYLANRLMRMVQERLPEPLSADVAPVMCDAVIGYARALSSVELDETVAWTGPFAPSMYTPLRLTPRSCGAWAEARNMTEQLAAGIKVAVEALDTKSSPACIILGGIGTVWPCIEKEIRMIVPVWPGGPAPRLVADGAAAWPTIRLWGRRQRELSSQAGAKCDEAIAPGGRDRPDQSPTAPSQRAQLPPWQRPRFPLGNGD